MLLLTHKPGFKNKLHFSDHHHTKTQSLPFPLYAACSISSANTFTPPGWYVTTCGT
jgi:hypothetical protein